jgi:hypothetical protein
MNVLTRIDRAGKTAHYRKFTLLSNRMAQGRPQPIYEIEDVIFVKEAATQHLLSREFSWRTHERMRIFLG